jgi:hypothetical protein
MKVNWLTRMIKKLGKREIWPSTTRTEVITLAQITRVKEIGMVNPKLASSISFTKFNLKMESLILKV